ncbi:NAD-specific glutamate dehydrogenase [Trachymyrmex cornetzi]|uniref:NAD-specific glutamate dehydrogenase n=1 Tax=Trachymyrmex cornetzi TaxID=471704 RepID=A0A195DML6_9HYME|nr:NAD-specific glutamate dehydrogenase [Trachymyrmex cornetzi]
MMSLHLSRIVCLSDALILSFSFSSSTVLFMLKQDRFFLLLVLTAVFLCLVHHSFNILFAESTLIIGDSDLVLLASRLVYGGYIEDTVRIDVERHLNLRNSTRCWWNTAKLEFVCFVGMVVFLLMRAVMTPPAVSIPRESGVTSSKSKSCTSSDLSPCKIAASSDQNDIVDLSFVHLGVAQRLLNGFKSTTEEIGAEFLETSSGDGVIDHAIIEVLATQMSISSRGLDLEDTIFDGQDGHIKSATTEIKDKDVSLAGCLLVETVCNRGGSGLVDNTQYVQARDGTSVLGCLTLRVVEVSGDGDHSVGDSLA